MVEEKPAGPDQLKLAPTTVAVVNCKVPASQTGVLLLGAGVAGFGFTFTLVVPASLVQPFTVTVTA